MKNPQDSARVLGVFQAHYKNLNSLKCNLKRMIFLWGFAQCVEIVLRMYKIYSFETR